MDNKYDAQLRKDNSPIVGAPGDDDDDTETIPDSVAQVAVKW